jgi:hypothetical protein
MRLDPNDPQVRVAVFGKQVEDFLNGDIGAYLVRRAETQAEEAIEALKTVSPWRRRRITQLQARIAAFEGIQQWLADAIVDGRQALNLIEGAEE